MRSFVGMRTTDIKLLILIPLIGMIVGCATTSAAPSQLQGLAQGAVQEIYTYDKAVAEKGPADRVEELDNGHTDAAWIIRKSRSRIYLSIMTFNSDGRFISSRRRVSSTVRMAGAAKSSAGLRKVPN